MLNETYVKSVCINHMSYLQDSAILERILCQKKKKKKKKKKRVWESIQLQGKLSTYKRFKNW